MTQDDGGYELTPKPEPPPTPPPVAPAPDASSPAANATPEASPKPGEPGWVPPTPIVESLDYTNKEGVEPDYGDPSDPDVQTHKGLAVLGYVLFLIPLVAAPNSKFARYHGNQGLLLFILLMIATVAVVILHFLLYIVNTFLTIGILNFFFGCGFHLLQFVMLAGWAVLTVMGIINAANGLKKPLPVIGHWTLIK